MVAAAKHPSPSLSGKEFGSCGLFSHVETEAYPGVATRAAENLASLLLSPWWTGSLTSGTTECLGAPGISQCCEVALAFF